MPDGMGDATNFYPDPFIEAGSNINELEGVQNVFVAGMPEYYADRIVLPVGSFLGVFWICRNSHIIQQRIILTH